MGKPEKPTEAIAMLPRPIPLPVLPESIPAELKAMNAWVMWRYVWKDKRWTKPPLKCNGRSASVTNPKTWTTFDEAFAAYQIGGFDGIGIVLQDDIAGIDLDHCVIDDSLEPWAAEILECFGGTYIERSPSGNGYRLFARGKIAQSGKGAINKRIEVYGTGSPRYMTVTGHRLADSPAGLTKQQRALDWLHITHIMRLASKQEPRQHSACSSLNDIELVTAICRSKYGSRFDRLRRGDPCEHTSQSEADFELCRILAAWTSDSEQIDRVFRESGLIRDKWDELRGTQTYGQLTIAKALSARLELGGLAASAPGASMRGMSLIWLRDVSARLSARWLVGKLLPHTGLAVVYGESGCGKTFICLDIALHVAAGFPWAGRRCMSGVVVYIAAENPASVENRAALWRQSHPDSASAPFAVLPHTVNLHDHAADLGNLLDLLDMAQEEHGHIALVVMDTLARAMGTGDENTAKDMGAITAACDSIRDRFDCLVMLVHHTGKDANRGARGHSSLKAATDVEIEIKQDGPRRFAEVTKLRDGPRGACFEFRLEELLVGQDEEGEEVTTCLVSEVHEMTPEPKRKPKKRSAAQALALSALYKLVDFSAASRAASDVEILLGARPGQQVVTVDEWRQACYFRGISDGDQGAKQKAFSRAFAALRDEGCISIAGDYIWPTEGDTRTGPDKVGHCPAVHPDGQDTTL